MASTEIEALITNATLVDRKGWSAYEFNLTVAVEAGLKLSDEKSPGKVLLDTSGTGLFPFLKTSQRFDPVNDWEFVNGLLGKYNICLLQKRGKCYAYNEKHNCVATNKNPLKAALTVFLHIVLEERKAAAA
jgi:hypothetical protein